MSGTGLSVLQTAIYGSLTASAPFMALVTGVYDAPPQDAAHPFVVIGEATEVPFKEFGRNGHECTLTLHIHDRDGAAFAGVAAKGYKRSQAILNAMVPLLEAITSVTGHATVTIDYEFGSPMREVDDAGAVYRHIPTRFRAVLQDTP